jgi:site-specific DNA recombinase
MVQLDDRNRVPAELFCCQPMPTRRGGVTHTTCASPTTGARSSGCRLSIELNKTALAAELFGQEKLVPSESETIALTAPLSIARRGSEVRLILENGEPSDAKPIPSLTKAIAWSRIWPDKIVEGELVTMEDLVKSAGVSRIHACRMLRCATLSPGLTTKILEGRHPIDLTLQKLTRDLPLEWERQTLISA